MLGLRQQENTYKRRRMKFGCMHCDIPLLSLKHLVSVINQLRTLELPR